MNKGVLYGVLAFSWWGLFPIYWRALASVPALEILSHRIVWSIFWLVLLISLTTLLHKRSRSQPTGIISPQTGDIPGTGWRAVINAARNPALMRTLMVASIMLSINWGLYIWAVNTLSLIHI